MPEVDYPGAIPFWSHPTNIYFPVNHGNVENQPRAFCLHTPEEPAGDNYPGTPIWFAKPNVGGSTHYFVEAIEDPNRTGYCKVYQCVPETHGAIANGKTADKPWPSWADRSTSLNWQTLSVEIEGYAATIHETLTPMQLGTVVDLIKHRAAAHGFPTDREHVFGHYEVSSNRTDPGARFPWDELMRLLNEPEEEEEPMYTRSNGIAAGWDNRTVTTPELLNIYEAFSWLPQGVTRVEIQVWMNWDGENSGPLFVQDGVGADAGAVYPGDPYGHPGYGIVAPFTGSDGSIGVRANEGWPAQVGRIALLGYWS